MVGENYTNTFGGENVSPANLSYVAYTISAPLALSWQFEAAPGDTVTADKIDINCTAANTTVAMPPADRVTVGQDVLFGGIGSEPFVVTDYGGNPICTIESGVEWFIWLTDNATKNGVWRAVLFGASGSAGDAVALAGAGLRANVRKLDQHLPATLLASSYTVMDSDRATVLEHIGGGVTYLFPDASVVGNGWFVYIVNAGDGSIILTPQGTETIDGAASKTIAPGESLAVLSDGGDYHSLGYGRLIDTHVTATAIPVGGAAGTTVLSPTQVGAQIQDYSGVLTGNRRIEYGAVVGYWFIYNNTSGAFTLTLAGGAADPGVVVAQGSFSIVRSNGFNGPNGMSVAFTATSGTVTSVATSADLTGGPITTTGTIGLSSTGVTPGTYGTTGTPYKMAAVTVDVKGRITAASNINLGSSANVDTGTTAGKVPLLDAGGNLPSLNGGMQPGDVQYSIALTKPGFVFANGTTIGSAASAATQRANADTINLFTVIWALPAAQFPIQTSTGLASTRAADAITDFNANKRLPVPDLRGTVIAGLDNAGGVSSASRLSTYIASTTMGAIGGGQATAANLNIPQLFVRVGYWASPVQGSTAAASVSVSGVTDGESADITNLQFGGSGIAAESHTHNWGTTTGSISWSQASFGAYGLTDVVNNTGGVSGQNGTTTFTIVQPTMVMNPFIKL